MQSKEEIEKHYENPDPWGYQKSPEDEKRKRYILHMLKLFTPKGGKFESALDIGCGEGWITKDLPAKRIAGFEISDSASARFPKKVERFVPGASEEKFDLVVATGVLYGHYDFRLFLDLIKKHAGRYILLSNVAAWEVKQVSEVPGFRLLELQFPYWRDGQDLRQQLRMFEVAP